MKREKRDLNADAVLGFPDYLGYFFGAGTNIPGYILSAFLLIYYSNVRYLGLTRISLILAFSKIFDGISDLLMGRIVDRTKSRFGKARVWYARMILPTSVCVLLLFGMPSDLSGQRQDIYIFITYNLVTTVCLTANAVAHASMIGFMTLNTKSRGIVGVMSMISNTIFTILVTNFFLKFCTFFGDGNPYSQKGFRLTILLYLAVYAVCSLLAFILTRERVDNVKSSSETEMDRNVPLKAALKSLFTNEYWILCIVMCLGFYFLFSYASSVMVYFAQYIMGDLNLQRTLSTLMYLFIILGIVTALPVMIHLGKRPVMAVGFIISAFGWFMPQISLNKTFVAAASVVVGIGFGCIAAPAGSFLQDTLTYGTWKSGVSAIGMGNAVFSFVNKLSSALGISVLGMVLDRSNFDASLPSQPESALTAIRILYIWLPVVICLICLGLTCFYDLDWKLPIIEAEIKDGRIGEKRSALVKPGGRGRNDAGKR